MKEYPELSKKLNEVEDRQHRRIGRRMEAHDARDTPSPETELAFVASSPATSMPLEHALEQLPGGPTMGPSGPGGEEPFDAEKSVDKFQQVEQFQQKINMLERSIEDLKEKVFKAKESKGKLKEEERMRNLSQEGLNPLKVVADKKPESKCNIAELFSPPRMTEMTETFGLKGGWSVDDRIEDPITKRTYDLRNKRTRMKSGG